MTAGTGIASAVLARALDADDLSPARGGAPTAAAFAGLGRRVLAALIDAAVLILLLLVESYALLELAELKVDRERLTAADLPYFLIAALIAWLYCAGMESGRRGATLGKRLFGLEVLDLAGERPGFARASLRFALRALTFPVGWLWIPLTQRRQALHDLAARTIVVRSGRRPS